jgi:NADPH:quinone reductase-like Zn-dependent oxidoreductase
MALKNTRFLVCSKGTPLIATTADKPTINEPNEVIIRLKAIAINPADIEMIDQGARATSWPLVAGMNGSGIVEAVGDDVKNVTSGDEVLAYFTLGDRSGSYQTFAVVQDNKVAIKPANWSFEDAATSR